MAASAFHRASSRSRRGATCCRLSQVNSHIANGANMATFSADLAGTVATMTEGQPLEWCKFNITVDPFTNPATRNGIIFTDPNSGNYPNRFYRAMQQ